MTMELSFKTLPVFLLVLVHISSSSINSCCRFQHLDYCQVFNLGGTPYCTQDTRQGTHWGCNVEEGGKKNAVPAHITDIDVMYQIEQCLNFKGSSNDASCQQYHSHGFITLNVSFALGDPSLTGILFQVVSSKNLLGSPSCHFVFLNGTLRYDHIIEDQRAKIFYFAGFDEVFEPNTKYIVYIRVLPAPRNRDLDRIYNVSVQIPDCNHLPDDIYFCSKPSAAKWVSDITTAVLEDQESVNVSFTINNDTRHFTDYEIKLWQLPGNETVHRRLVTNNKNNWDCDGQTCVMHEAFNISAGHYYVTVQANKNGYRSSQACRNDRYRVQKECRMAYSAKFVVEDTFTTVTSTGLKTTPATTIDDAQTDLPQLWLFVAVILGVTGAVIIFFGASFCIWCVWKHRYHRDCSPGGDDETVEQWNWDFVTLVGLPHRGHGLPANSIGKGLSTGDLSECMSVNGTSSSVAGNHFSQFNYAPLMRFPHDANHIDNLHKMGLTENGLSDYHLLQSEKPNLSHSDEGYSENGAPINPDDWQRKRHPADRQDSGISMTQPQNENLDDVTTISDGSSLPDGGQHSLKYPNGVKYHSLTQLPLSEKITGKVTTV